MKNRLVFIAFIVCLMSCGAPTKDVCIDNPTDSEIIVQFDGDEPIQIQANGKKCVAIKFGNRTLQYKDTQTELVLDGERDYIINPTKSLYYIQNIPYVVSQKGQENYNNDYGSQKKSTVKGWEVNGDYEEIQDKVLIAKDWTFGLDQEVNESVGIHSNPRSGYYIVRKLHRASDLGKDITESLLNQLQESFEEQEQ